MSIDELGGLAIGNFWAGADTIRSVCTWACYNLAKYPETFEKLLEEVDELNRSLESGSFSYDNIQDLKYMQAVISEVLRIVTPLPIIDRRCTKPFTMEDYNGNKVHLEIGDSVIIPARAIHNDEKFYPDPEKFDPERFIDKSNLNQSAFLPFGNGPRNCIGGRLAMMFCKILLYQMFSNLSIDKSNVVTDHRYGQDLQMVFRVRD